MSDHAHNMHAHITQRECQRNTVRPDQIPLGHVIRLTGHIRIACVRYHAATVSAYDDDNDDNANDGGATIVAFYLLHTICT